MTKNKNNDKDKKESEYTPVDIFEKSSKLSGDWLDRTLRKDFPANQEEREPHEDKNDKK